MALYYVTLLSGFSIAIPTLAAVLRYKIFSAQYLPLFVLLLLGFFNESVSALFIFTARSNAINSNIYVLLEFLLILWQYSRMGISHSRSFLTFLMVLGVTIWILDNCILSRLQNNNSLFRMCSSLILVYVSIEKANELLFFNRAVPFRNPDLLISIGFFAYFAFKTFIEAFNVFPMKVDQLFYADLWTIHSVINILTNLLFTVAILCIRQKEEHILRS